MYGVPDRIILLDLKTSESYGEKDIITKINDRTTFLWLDSTIFPIHVEIGLIELLETGETGVEKV